MVRLIWAIFSAWLAVSSSSAATRSLRPLTLTPPTWFWSCATSVSTAVTRLSNWLTGIEAVS